MLCASCAPTKTQAKAQAQAPTKAQAPTVNAQNKTLNFIQSEGQKIFYQRVYSFKDIPWGFDFLSPNKLLITLKGGKMYVLESASGSSKPQAASKAGVNKTKSTSKSQASASPIWKKWPVVEGPQSNSIGQGGLMDVRLHPNFKSNRWVYFSYVKAYQGGHGTRVARAKLNTAPPYKLTQLEVLFTPSPPGRGGRHFGSRLEWGASPKNKFYLFFGIGDRGDRKYAQQLTDPRGKIFRLFDNGQIPPDNPFSKSKAYPGVWSYGHRNPQAMFRHPHTKALWSNEHGPRGGDEINRIVPGHNYGWPVITYGREYWGPRIGTTHRKGMQQPVKYFVPSIAPSSLMIYSGKKFKKWRGDFFSTSLVLTHLNRLVIKNNKVFKEERLFKKLGQRLRHIRENSKGDIFFSTDSGHIYKMF